MASERFGEGETPSTGSSWSAGDKGTVTTESGSGKHSGNGQDTKETAKEQSREVAREGVKAGGRVAAVAGDQAKGVAVEAGQQAKALMQQARSELTESLATQQNRLADQLQALSQELGSMASTSEQEGLGANLASQASRQVGGIAHWISGREPGEMMTDLKDVARRKPGTFLAVAAGIGLVAGRMTRGAAAGTPEPPERQDATTHPAGDGYAGEQSEQARGEFLPPPSGGTR